MTAPVLDRYRCRAHSEIVVTWRGTGCRRCAAATPSQRRPSKRRGQYDVQDLPEWVAQP